MRAAALFAGVAWQLNPINLKHLPSNQPLGITGQQHLAEQSFDLATQVSHKLGNVPMARLAVTTDGNKLNVVLPLLLDGPA
jgi:hypothetical protein